MKTKNIVTLVTVVLGLNIAVPMYALAQTAPSKYDMKKDGDGDGAF